MSSYTLGLWEEIFQVLEVEAQKTPTILSEGIRRLKRGVFKMPKRTVHLTEPDPEEMSLSGGEDKIAWLGKWNNCDQEDKIMLYEYQDNLMVDVLKLQAIIGRGGRDEER